MTYLFYAIGIAAGRRSDVQLFRSLVDPAPAAVSSAKGRDTHGPERKQRARCS